MLQDEVNIHVLFLHLTGFVSLIDLSLKLFSPHKSVFDLVIA